MMDGNDKMYMSGRQRPEINCPQERQWWEDHGRDLRYPALLFTAYLSQLGQFAYQKKKRPCEEKRKKWF